MSHFVDKAKIEKAGVAVTEGVVLGGFAACALAAVIFDLWTLMR